jgi:hypothetical protein
MAERVRQHTTPLRVRDHTHQTRGSIPFWGHSDSSVRPSTNKQIHKARSPLPPRHPVNATANVMYVTRFALALSRSLDADDDAMMMLMSTPVDRASLLEPLQHIRKIARTQFWATWRFCTLASWRQKQHCVHGTAAMLLSRLSHRGVLGECMGLDGHSIELDRFTSSRAPLTCTRSLARAPAMQLSSSLFLQCMCSTAHPNLALDCGPVVLLIKRVNCLAWCTQMALTYGNADHTCTHR